MFDIKYEKFQFLHYCCTRHVDQIFSISDQVSYLIIHYSQDIKKRLIFLTFVMNYKEKNFAYNHKNDENKCFFFNSLSFSLSLSNFKFFVIIFWAKNEMNGNLKTKNGKER